MSKVFTAQEMRQRADEEERHWNDHVTAAMLRQAADESESVGKLKSMLHEITMIASECDECDTYNRTEFCAEAIGRISSVINASADEKKYEYGVRYFVDDGSVFEEDRHFDSLEEAKDNADVSGYDELKFIRRSVGEWEEVRDGD